MRKWLWAFAFLAPLILAMPTLETRAQTAPAGHHKLALLVGISTYERGGQQPPDWWNLDCENDVTQMKQVLETRFGFADKNITTLTTKDQTTRESILAAFRQLIDKAQPGDVVWFHYSGHGQQVPELQEGQELNGLDSSLIPSNYIDQHAGTVDPATHKPIGNINIRGTEMAELLNALKAKVGTAGSITLSIDCCFAGSATRGDPPNGRLKERGRGWNVALDGPLPGTGAKKTTRGGDAAEGAGLFPASETAQGGYVLLAATSINETAKEKDDDNQKPMGAFTYYLVKELSQLTPDSQMTYRELFERLQTDIVGNVRDQSPQAEGDLDKPLLGGARVVPDAAYVRVLDGDADAHTVTLGAGELEGVSVGSQYALYPPGTTNFKDAGKRIATITVSDIDLNDATATLDAKYQTTVKPKALVNARAYELAHKYGDSALKVTMTGLAGTPTESKFKEQLKTSQVASLSTDAFWDVLIKPAPKERGGAGPALLIERKDGTAITTVPQDDSAAVNLGSALENEWKWQYINKLENTDADSGIKIEMRLVPVEVEGVPGKVRGTWKKKNTIHDKPLPTNGALAVNEGDNYVIEVRNTGYKDAYVTVLDLTADGQVSCWYPIKSDHVREPIKGEGANATWHRLPGDYLLFSQAPYGAEFFKAIGTDTPADFSSLVTDAQNGNQRGGEDNPAAHTPLGRLLLSGLKGQRGGAAMVPSDWGTASATIINKAPDGRVRGIPAMSK